MPELMRRQSIGLSLMEQARCKLLQEHLAEHISTERALCVTEEIVFLKVIRKRLRAAAAAESPQ